MNATNSINTKSNLRRNGTHGWMWDNVHTFEMNGRQHSVLTIYKTNKAGRGLYLTYDNGRTVLATHPSRYSLRGMEMALVAAEVGVPIV
jgi:hypothetical protein